MKIMSRKKMPHYKANLIQAWESYKRPKLFDRDFIKNIILVVFLLYRRFIFTSLHIWYDKNISF